jgi:tRNA A37 threonylcarbamoyltransferase TsaD
MSKIDEERDDLSTTEMIDNMARAYTLGKPIGPTLKKFKEVQEQ